MKEFTLRVKEITKRIPAGSTMTYKEVADLAGNSKASRAVASILSRNYDSEIPCHRVIRSDGSLGGYNRGGEIQKRVLLDSEKVSNVN